MPTPYAAGLTGQALVAAALGRGHRLIARDLGVPHGTVRGWIRRACRSAGQLRAAGVRAVVALDPDALPARILPSELAYALDALGAAAVALGGRFGVQHVSPWARVVVLTRGRLLGLPRDPLERRTRCVTCALSARELKVAPATPGQTAGVPAVYLGCTCAGSCASTGPLTLPGSP